MAPLASRPVLIYLQAPPWIPNQCMEKLIVISILNNEKQLHTNILAEPGVKEISIVWQCEFEAAMKDPQTDVYAFFQSRQQQMGKQLPPPLRLRSALRGGNTEIFQMQATADENYSIQYYDINSL